jgi:hypothetical protein
MAGFCDYADKSLGFLNTVRWGFQGYNCYWLVIGIRNQQNSLFVATHAQLS